MPNITNGLEALTRPSTDRTRCINAENPRGGKGRAAMTASNLGPSRKGTPCLKNIPPGQDVVLADLSGAGEIRHIWMTVTDATSPTGPNVLRNLILECYWDGEQTPSVCVPLGDFFCCGHAQACRVESVPVAVYPRRGFNCYWPMPFHSGARIVLRNRHNEPIEAFFYQIDYVEKDELPEEVMTFHAQWRRQRVTELGQDYMILDGVHGRGSYVGTYLALTALESRWWGEGEIKVYLDGDKDYPTWCSTGSEDYFGGAWSFAGQDPDGRMHEVTYSGAYMGFPFHSRQLDNRESQYWDADTPVTRGFYRWHIPDPIIFASDIKVTLQQIGVDEQGYFERQDDLASVAYWYQQEPHKPFPQNVLETGERDRRPR
ncbi:glycoside hydrolase family 172 protein [Bifidobacterium polysaccharolyticum]